MVSQHKPHNPRANPETIGHADVFGKLLPAVPLRYRAMVRECDGLTGGSVDLGTGGPRCGGDTVHCDHSPIPQVAGGSACRPASTGADRIVDDSSELAVSPRRRPGVPVPAGGPLRRNSFRRRVWLPSLVRVGALGRIEETDVRLARTGWPTQTATQTAMCRSHQEAIVLVANSSN